MKKNIAIFALLVMLFSQIPAKVVHAEAPTTIDFQESQLENTFTFEKLGYSEKLLVGPFDSTNILFGLPANMRLAPGSSINLQYALAWSGGGSSASKTGAGIGGTLLVYFNNELIDTIILAADSPLEKEIPIPDVALNKVDENGRYGLRFFLNADVNCSLDGVRTTLIISKNSQLNLQYEQIPALVDLSIFPRPIYQPDSILPTSALVVIPDNPEAFELQSAMSVMAGLGSITEGKLNVSMAANGSLTPELVAANHLIFVGLANKFSTLQAVDFPVAISNAGLSLSVDQKSSGIVEIAQSPWSPSAVVIFVGGNSPEAVVKAGQAFSTGKMVAVEKPDVSLIATVNPLQDSVIPEDQTFSDLGYGDTTMGLYGETYASYTFYASADQAFSEGAYVDMVINHSDLLDLDQTGVTVILNDEVIGGLRLEQESPTTSRIKLVPGTLRRGVNRLEVVSDVVPHITCYSSDLLSTWITISATSVVHLPISENKLSLGGNITLNDFPYMFLDSKDLGDLAFILAPNDPVSWSNASQVAFYIGAKSSSSLASLHVMYADNVPDDSLSNYNLLIFGRASILPFLSKINEALPAPFKSGTDEAVEPSMLVNYSLLPDTSVGYLQLLPSPWNPKNTILAVLGNTPNGIPMASTSLTKDDLVARLSGNFAVLYGDQVVSTDTRLGVGKESIISQLPVAVTVTPVKTEDAPQSVPNVKPETRPQWILPLFGIVTAGILILLVVMLSREARVKKMPKDGKSRENPSDPMQ